MRRQLRRLDRERRSDVQVIRTDDADVVDTAARIIRLVSRLDRPDGPHRRRSAGPTGSIDCRMNGMQPGYSCPGRDRRLAAGGQTDRGEEARVRAL
jgi:hypothetical protein